MIFGDRIRLRAIEREDIPRFVTWFNDPDVRHYLGHILPMSAAQETSWYESMITRDPYERPMAIEVRTPEGWQIIGNIGLMNFNWVSRHAEVGLVIGEKEFWNQGYGTEVMGLMLRFAFHTLNLNRVYLRVDARNKRGIRAYEKAGYVLEGRLRQDCYLDGEYGDTLLMGVLRSEWAAQRPGE